jgi:hypothetical protein
VRQIVSAEVDAQFRKPIGSYVPFDVYTNSGNGAVITSIKNIITRFFLNPNNTTYVCMWVVYNHYREKSRYSSSFDTYANISFRGSLRSLNPELEQKIYNGEALTVPLAASNDPDVQRVISASPFEGRWECRVNSTAVYAYIFRGSSVTWSAKVDMSEIGLGIDEMAFEGTFIFDDYGIRIIITRTYLEGKWSNENFDNAYDYRIVNNQFILNDGANGENLTYTRRQ